MHGTHSKKHTNSFKPKINGADNNHDAMIDNDTDRHEQPWKKTKHQYGHTVADVEQQISDWLDENGDIKTREKNNVSD